MRNPLAAGYMLGGRAMRNLVPAQALWEARS
jgi:hypothetical protein